MGRYSCKVCDDKVARRVVDEELGKGMSAAAVAKLMTLRGFSVGAPTVADHRKHAPMASVPAAAAQTKKDLAILVRDKTFDAVENGEISITDKEWRNVQPGLAAQKLLDQRENKRDDHKTAIALAMILSGASSGGPPAHLLDAGDEDMMIDGEYEVIGGD